jgi:hypothetical protein
MPNLLFIILAQIAQLEIDPPQLTINQSRQPFTWALSPALGPKSASQINNLADVISGIKNGPCDALSGLAGVQFGSKAPL